VCESTRLVESDVGIEEDLKLSGGAIPDLLARVTVTLDQALLDELGRTSERPLCCSVPWSPRGTQAR
jgi:hypothetical protein